MNNFRLLVCQAWYAGLDLVFPPCCVHCERVGSLLCSHCLATFVPAEPRTVPQLDQVWVAARYEGALRAAIHALKYGGQTRVAEVLGDQMADVLKGNYMQIDLVVGVPLGECRQQERGYNQAALLARRIADRIGAPDVPDALRRVRETASQVDLTAEQRRANVAGAFEAMSELVMGRCVLVVDDVLTTGATLSACAAALRQAGAAQVMGAAVGGAGYGMDR